MAGPIMRPCFFYVAEDMELGSLLAEKDSPITQVDELSSGISRGSGPRAGSYNIVIQNEGTRENLIVSPARL